MSEKDITLEAARATLKRLEAAEAARTQSTPLEQAVIGAAERERLVVERDTLRRRVAELENAVIARENTIKNLEELQLVRGLDLIEGLLTVVHEYGTATLTEDRRALVERAEQTLLRSRRGVRG